MSDVSKAEAATLAIRDGIRSGRLAPGHRLVLAQLADELRMSVVPVREAIRRLEAEGLVTFERNVGAQVALLRQEEYAFTMETLALVEGYATAIAAPSLTPDHLARAREINAQLRAGLAEFDPAAYTTRNLDFHAVLFEGCPNPHIRDLVDRGWQRMSTLRESSFSMVPHRAEESVEEHERIVAAIERGAPTSEIEHLAREHRLATLRAVQARQTTHLARSTPAAIAR